MSMVVDIYCHRYACKSDSPFSVNSAALKSEPEKYHSTDLSFHVLLEVIIKLKRYILYYAA